MRSGAPLSLPRRASLAACRSCSTSSYRSEPPLSATTWPSNAPRKRTSSRSRANPSSVSGTRRSLVKGRRRMNAAARLRKMTDGDGQILSEPPVAGDETQTLLGSLERQRATFAWKCDGLDAAGMRATVGASTMTLGGLVKHLALVEDHYFTHRLHGRDIGPPWNAVDFDTDPDWEWRTGAEDGPEALALWHAAVARSGSA